MTLPARFRSYILSRSTLHITKSSGTEAVGRYRPWWRKYWQVCSLHGERSKVGHHWVFGIRTARSAAEVRSSSDGKATTDEWASGACGSIITALCVAVANHQARDPFACRLCWITPTGNEAFSGPMPAFADALTHFPDYGVAITHPQQTIPGFLP